MLHVSVFRVFSLAGQFPWQLTEFIIGVFLQVLGLPFVAVAQVSLFSKITSEKTQGERLRHPLENRKHCILLSVSCICCCLGVLSLRFAVLAGFSQGVRRSVGGLATILGPLWAGGLTENMYIMLGMMMALLALLTVCKRNLEDRECVYIQIVASV